METENRTQAKPFEPARDYTKVPNAIFRLYTRLPDFKAEHALLYVYLCAQYNVEYGYAFPDTWDIMQALNCGERSVPGIKSVLVARGLIEVQRHPTHGNDVYFINPPITDEDEFLARFPEAGEYVEKRRIAMEQRKETGALRKRAFDERVRNRRICDR